MSQSSLKIELHRNCWCWQQFFDILLYFASLATILEKGQVQQTGGGLLI